MQATARRRAREPLYVEKPHLLFSNELNYTFRVTSLHLFEESRREQAMLRRVKLPVRNPKESSILYFLDNLCYKDSPFIKDSMIIKGRRCVTYCSDLTRERILECAKTEFLAKGYRAAQLKSIASAAQVTTGAIYRHFKDKNDLFLTLVKEVSEFTVARLDRDGCDAAGIQKALDSDSVEQTYAQVMDYIDYMYEHCDEFRLLLKCAQGSSAEDFTETISERYAAQNMAFIDAAYETGLASHRPSETEVHMLTRGYISAVCECIVRDIPYEQAKDYIKSIVTFHHYGWYGILGLSAK